MSDSYGTTFHPDLYAKYMSKIAYQELDLSHLYPTAWADALSPLRVNASRPFFLTRVAETCPFRLRPSQGGRVPITHIVGRGHGL